MPVSTPQADRDPRWFKRVSRSRRSCVTSRRRRANSSRSYAVKPSIAFSCRPSRLSATSTHAPIDYAVGSNARARSSGDHPARTRSTIWWRNPDEYGGCVLGIRNTSGESLRVFTKPGAILIHVSVPLCKAPMEGQASRNAGSATAGSRVPVVLLTSRRKRC